MIDWKQRKYPVGTKVMVTDAAKNEILGEGTLLTAYDLDSEDNVMPKIEMPSGKVLFGYECWWIPVDETKGKNLTQEE